MKGLRMLNVYVILRPPTLSNENALPVYDRVSTHLPIEVNLRYGPSKHPWGLGGGPVWSRVGRRAERAYSELRSNFP